MMSQAAQLAAAWTPRVVRNYERSPTVGHRFVEEDRTMQRDDENLRLAIAFLRDAQHDLDAVSAISIVQRGRAWQERRREAMRYWARAYAHFRACHAASKRVPLRSAA
jgi:hypothetical protein